MLKFTRCIRAIQSVLRRREQCTALRIERDRVKLWHTQPLTRGVPGLSVVARQIDTILCPRDERACVNLGERECRDARCQARARTLPGGAIPTDKNPTSASD